MTLWRKQIDIDPRARGVGRCQTSLMEFLSKIVKYELQGASHKKSPKRISVQIFNCNESVICVYEIFPKSAEVSKSLGLYLENMLIYTS